MTTQGQIEVAAGAFDGVSQTLQNRIDVVSVIPSVVGINGFRTTQKIIAPTAFTALNRPAANPTARAAIINFISLTGTITQVGLKGAVGDVGILLFDATTIFTDGKMPPLILPMAQTTGNIGFAFSGSAGATVTLDILWL